MSQTLALLRAGVAVPFLYYGALIVASLFFPGYSHKTQYASELGSAAATRPWIFNTGVVLGGLACVVASFGFFRAVRALTGARVLGAVAALTLALFGIGFVLGGVFPMPDPRHAGFGLSFAIHLTPFLLAAALWRRQRGLSVYLLVSGALLLLGIAVMMGVGSLVTRANVGIFQRLYSLCIFPWIGVSAWTLARALRRRGP
jgi:hypothetical membrane protein